MKATLLLLATLAGCAQRAPAPPTPAVPGVDVRHYDLALRLDPATRRVDGRVRIGLARADTLTPLPLSFAGLDVGAVLVDGAPAAARREGAHLVVPLPEGRDTALVEVRYGGVPPEGLYAGDYDGHPVVYTDAWPDRVRGWMPGVHHPADPATLTLTLDVPPGYEAVGTGVPTSVDATGDGVRYRWHLADAAPTYTFGFAVSDFAVTHDVLG